MSWQQARGLRLYGTNIRGPDLQQATTDYLSVLAGAAHDGFTPAEMDQADRRGPHLAGSAARAGGDHPERGTG